MKIKVFKSDRGWEVKIPSGQRASYIEDKKSIAVEKAKELAERRKCETIEIFKTSGELQKSIVTGIAKASKKTKSGDARKTTVRKTKRATSKNSLESGNDNRVDRVGVSVDRGNTTHKRKHKSGNIVPKSSVKRKSKPSKSNKAKQTSNNSGVGISRTSLNNTTKQPASSSTTDTRNSSTAPRKKQSDKITIKVIQAGSYELPIVVYKDKYVEPLDKTHIGFRVEPAEDVNGKYKTKYFLKQIFQPGEPKWPEGGYRVSYVEGGYTLYRDFFFEEIVLHKTAKRALKKKKRAKRKAKKVS